MVLGGVWEESDHSAFPVHHSLQIVETKEKKFLKKVEGQC